jgi:predicted NBD/HSP70 family sugar kinase
MALLERLLLASFAGSGGLTRLDLEELTGLSRTVVAGVVSSLVARGELVEAHEPPAPGARGRPPARYQRAALLPPVLLIELTKDGATSVSSVSGDGTRRRAVGCAPWSAPWRAWSRSVADAVGLLNARSQAPPRLAVLSVPFPVAEGQGAPQMHEVPTEDESMLGWRLAPRSRWLEEDPRPALSDRLGCTALLVNDANLAALGEAHFGAGRGHRAVVHVSVVGGIGAGFVFEGRLFTGAHGFSGELAHVQVTADGKACPCGNRGCLATEVRCGPGHAPGDRAKLGPLVGRALAPLVTTLDPDCVVVDARLADRAAAFMAGVTSELARRCPPQVAVAVVAGELEDAQRFGALAAADAHAVTLLSQPAWSSP